MSYIYGAPCKARNFNVVYIWKNYYIMLFLESPKTEIYMRAVHGKLEDRKMRKKTWEAARWPWGWEMMLSFEGGGSGLCYVEEPFWRRLWTCR
jgi:hypothetical protein